MSSAEPSRGARAGFTLVELAVAMLISGILITVVFQLISGQSRVVAVQGAKEEVQQNVRGALEVISADLRGVFPRGIVQADAQQITFMQPRAWGIVCGSGATTIDALFPVTGGPRPDVSATSGVIVNVGASPDAASWFPVPPARAPITAVDVLGGPTAGQCVDRGGEGSVETVRITTDAATAAAAVPGNQVAAYHMTRYDIAERDGAWWIRRSTGWDNGGFSMQPLAGPAEQEGFRLQYYADAGDVTIDPEPGTNSALLSTIRMVSVQAITTSTQQLNGIVQRDSGSVRVMLRNAQ